MAIEALTEEDIVAQLAERPEWARVDGRHAINRKLKFKDFVTAFGFMTAVALEAQAINHHPDWSNSWATVDITLTDHTTGGLTHLDFDLAGRIDTLAAAASAEPAATD